MEIASGNLSIEEIEERAGVKFPRELVEYMKPRRTHKIKISKGEWRAFDIPFSIFCGDKEMAYKIYDYLLPLENDFKEKLQLQVVGDKDK